jgi:hypothetical protein
LNVPDSAHRSPRIDRLNELPLTERRHALRRLAAASRTLNHLICDTSASAASLDDVAELLEAVVLRLQAHPGASPYEGIQELANAGDAIEILKKRVESGDPEAWANFDFSPLIGLASPLSPPVRLSYDDEGILGVATFGPAYEGPPGCVHGGFIAAVFDEVLGATQSLSGDQGMTANLSINYRNPTPLNEEIVIRGYVERREGRKIFVNGSMRHGETETATATALFIAFDRGRFLELLQARRQESAE